MRSIFTAGRRALLGALFGLQALGLSGCGINSVARRDYIAAVERYNREIHTFLGRIWHAVLYRDMPLRETVQTASEYAGKALEAGFR
ncbi:hypothetical protein [Microbulbifer sp.]|uniref:hypothetical protein n=1 Tax=Microbulbifer sp. TaxID=1908541 RepID=UPI003F3F52A1